MMTWHKVRGYLASTIALIACPCHLPITFPLLLGLTAGTALGAWLEGSFNLILAISSIVFIAGLGLSMLWLGKDKQPGAARLAPQKRAVQPAAVGGKPVIGDPLHLTLVTSSLCSSCEKARLVWEQVGRERPLEIHIVDINSPEGRELAAANNIFATPTTLMEGKVAVRGVPSLRKARELVGNKKGEVYAP